MTRKLDTAGGKKGAEISYYLQTQKGRKDEETDVKSGYVLGEEKNNDQMIF